MFLYDTPPCKFCKNRYVNCHSECKNYLLWKFEHNKKRNNITEKFRVENQIKCDKIDAIFKFRKKHKNKY